MRTGTKGIKGVSKNRCHKQFSLLWNTLTSIFSGYTIFAEDYSPDTSKTTTDPDVLSVFILSGF